jgi:hypothetical protein
MTNQQFNKILDCVKCGISIPIAMRRLYGIKPNRPKLFKNQYRELQLILFLFNKYREGKHIIDYDIIEYINGKEFVEINKHQVLPYPPRKKPKSQELDYHY